MHTQIALFPMAVGKDPVYFHSVRRYFPYNKENFGQGESVDYFLCLQEENEELKRHVFQLECKLFMKMDSYRLIEQKCHKKCLNPDEKQQLNTDIHWVFKRLVQTIRQACSSLTDDDVLFCCLAKSGFANTVVCRCMGSVSKQTVNQRKYRIKKKMKEAKCDALFDMIFTNE